MRRPKENGIPRAQSRLRCAIYTRKSSEEGLEQDFNSLDAQREACEAYVASQRHEGWGVLPQMYDDGGFSGAHPCAARRHQKTPCLRLVASVKFPATSSRNEPTLTLAIEGPP